MPNYLELLKLYYEEWKFRQENLWKRLIQFFVIIFFASTLPITIRIFNGVSIPNVPLAIFPITGILLTVFFIWFFLSESIRIKTIDIKIKTIINDHFPSQYAKNGLEPLIDGHAKTLPIFRWHMSIWVPTFLAVTEFIIAIFMLYLIFTGKLMPEVLPLEAHFWTPAMAV